MKKMFIIDIIIFIILGAFLFYGFWFGFIRVFGSVVALLVGIWVANYYYNPVFEFIQSWFFGYDIIAKTAAYFAVFIVANRLVMLAFGALQGLFNIVAILPFLGLFNRIIGAIFGLFEGVLVFSLLFYFLLTVIDWPIVGDWLTHVTARSHILPYFYNVINILSPIFPEIINRAKIIL